MVFFFLLLSACSTPPKEGVLKGNLSYKYNNYVGNKPDVGAKVTLISKAPLSGKPFGRFNSQYFECESNVNGDYEFNNVPPGEYLLIAQSNTTHASPKDEELAMKYDSPKLSKLFYEPDSLRVRHYLTFWKTFVKDVVIESDKTIVINNDFGITYF